MTNSAQLRIAQTVTCTEAEGPGKRFAIWFQGCPLRCEACCNPEMLPTTGGELVSVDKLLTAILAARDSHDIEGITLIGGEPFAQPASAAQIAAAVQQAGLTVMIFSGFTLAEIRSTKNAACDNLLAHTDLLVDGPYDRTRPDISRRWVGSTNQQIHFFTERYQSDDPRWREANTLEIRLENNELSVNGFPAKSAVGLWKRPKK